MEVIPFLISRDDPVTIKRRFISVVFTIAVSTIILAMFTEGNFLQKVGLTTPTNLIQLFETIFYPVTLTALLFLGPILGFIFQIKHPCERNISPLIVLRNYFVAPLTEEYIFRGVLLSILGDCWSSLSAIIISSSLFGIAHSHHYLSQWFSNSNVQIIAHALLQITYTTVFGLYAASLYHTTQSIITAMIVHSFCNIYFLCCCLTFSSTSFPIFCCNLLNSNSFLRIANDK